MMDSMVIATAVVCTLFLTRASRDSRLAAWLVFGKGALRLAAGRACLPPGSASESAPWPTGLKKRYAFS